MDVKIISKPEDILDFDRTVSMRHSSEYSVDLEGDNLSRHGLFLLVTLIQCFVFLNKIFIKNKLLISFFNFFLIFFFIKNIFCNTFPYKEIFLTPLPPPPFPPPA